MGGRSRGRPYFDHDERDESKAAARSIIERQELQFLSFPKYFTDYYNLNHTTLAVGCEVVYYSKGGLNPNKPQRVLGWRLQKIKEKKGKDHADYMFEIYDHEYKLVRGLMSAFLDTPRSTMEIRRFAKDHIRCYKYENTFSVWERYKNTMRFSNSIYKMWDRRRNDKPDLDAEVFFNYDYSKYSKLTDDEDNDGGLVYYVSDTEIVNDSQREYENEEYKKFLEMVRRPKIQENEADRTIREVLDNCSDFIDGYTKTAKFKIGGTYEGEDSEAVKEDKSVRRKERAIRRKKEKKHQRENPGRLQWRIGPSSPEDSDEETYEEMKIRNKRYANKIAMDLIHNKRE